MEGVLGGAGVDGVVGVLGAGWGAGVVVRVVVGKPTLVVGVPACVVLVVTTPGCGEAVDDTAPAGCVELVASSVEVGKVVNDGFDWSG
jgi:hypothetical protein